MIRRIGWALAVLLGAGVTWLTVPTAGAATAKHPTAGTYRLYVGGESPPSTIILQYDHNVYPWGIFPPVSWSVQNGVVIIRSEDGGLVGSISYCAKYGQPPACSLNTTWIGRKTARGIGSRSSPGTATNFVGTYPLSMTPFYAVRIGGVPSGIRAHEA